MARSSRSCSTSMSSETCRGGTSVDVIFTEETLLCCPNALKEARQINQDTFVYALACEASCVFSFDGEGNVTALYLCHLGAESERVSDGCGLQMPQIDMRADG